MRLFERVLPPQSFSRSSAPPFFFFFAPLNFIKGYQKWVFSKINLTGFLQTHGSRSGNLLPKHRRFILEGDALLITSRIAWKISKMLIEKIHGLTCSRRKKSNWQCATQHSQTKPEYRLIIFPCPWLNFLCFVLFFCSFLKILCPLYSLECHCWSCLYAWFIYFCSLASLQGWQIESTQVALQKII